MTISNTAPVSRYGPGQPVTPELIEIVSQIAGQIARQIADEEDFAAGVHDKVAALRHVPSEHIVRAGWLYNARENRHREEYAVLCFLGRGDCGPASVEAALASELRSPSTIDQRIRRFRDFLVAYQEYRTRYGLDA